VVSLSLTPLGAARLATLRPSSDPGLVQRQLATTTEAVRFLTDHAGFPLRAPAGIDTTLTALAIEGRPLEPVRLAGLVTLLESIEQCTHLVRRAPRDAYPLLHELVTRAANFDHEIGDVRRRDRPVGELFDHASPELRIIRDRLRRQRTRLRGTLESYLRARTRRSTSRPGHHRPQRPVRAPRACRAPGRDPGHRARQLDERRQPVLEPLSTVEINNEIVALAEQEAEEVRRILLALTDAFRRRALELTQTLERRPSSTRCRPARASRGWWTALRPRCPRTGRSTSARPAIRCSSGVAARLAAEGPDRPARAADPVPVDLRLSPPTTVLVITGPNTGGKTVALKTAGSSR